MKAKLPATIGYWCSCYSVVDVLATVDNTLSLAREKKHWGYDLIS